MFARSVSITLSILALGLMVLACSLGYRDTETTRQPEGVQVVAQAAQVPDLPELRQCSDTARRLTGCAEALQRLENPPVRGYYPDKIRRIMVIKKRYYLEKEATQACGCFPDAPLAPESYEAYLYRQDCPTPGATVATNELDL